MSEADPLEGVRSLVVTTDDGTLVYCSPVKFGGPNAPFPPNERFRWELRASGGRNYIGPPIAADRSPDAVQRLVSAWWRANAGSEASPT